jgi:hypothetical protein
MNSKNKIFIPSLFESAEKTRETLWWRAIFQQRGEVVLSGQGRFGGKEGMDLFLGVVNF